MSITIYHVVPQAEGWQLLCNDQPLKPRYDSQRAALEVAHWKANYVRVMGRQVRIKMGNTAL